MRILFSLLTLMLSVTVMAQTESQWHGPNRDGIYPDKNLLKSWPAEGPKLLWRFDEIGTGHASAAVTKDFIYTAGVVGLNGFIFCFTPDGKLVWKMPYGEEWMESWPGTRSTPMINDGKIYFLSGMGKLMCLNTQNGSLVWTINILNALHGKNIQWGLTENLLIDGNTLYCTPGGPDTNVVAMDKNSGKTIWVSKGNGEKSAYCSPILIKLSARNVFVTQTENSILGIDAGTGKLLWRHDQPNRYSVHANTPIFHDGNLFCSSGYGKGGVMLKLAADGSSVQEVWRNSNMDNRMGGFVLINGRIYGSDDNGKAWYCLDWATGKVIFSEKITGKGSIISADGMLYCYGDNGEIALAEPTPTGFKKISSFKVPFGTDQHWAHLVIANGRLYVRHGNSLMVYQISL